jgi:hypothetical protein
MAIFPNGQTTRVFDDHQVDDFADGSTGVIDAVPSLSFDMPDNTIVNNLERRIKDSARYYDSATGFDLSNIRNQNKRAFLGRQIDLTKLYAYQTPYVENQLYVGIEASVAYLTAQAPSPEVYPADDKPISRIFAANTEKAMRAHSDLIDLVQKAENAVRHISTGQRIAYIKLEFDPYYGQNGEIVPRVINPEHVVVDKNAKQGENPGFISETLKMTVNEVLSRWPEKKKEVFDELGIKMGTPNQLEQVIAVREVWVTHYDKKFQPSEGVVYYFGRTVLEKAKNPNWIYATSSKNFLRTPLKPYIPLNFDNDGEHWIDYTSPIEQATILQDALNKRGRQLMEVADKANGILVISSDSGLTSDDVENLTGDPNQRILIKTNGQKVQDLVYQVPPPEVPAFLMQDKIDLRTQVHAVLGTPSEFTGADDGGAGDQTLGQSEMKKNQASGRQDLYVRAIDRFFTRYFNYLMQMMVVWYDEKHFFTYNSGDGEFDYIVMHRDLIEVGSTVSVKSGGSLPFDKRRQEAIALQMAKLGIASPLDIFKLLNLPNAQQLYDNYAKFKADPMGLARNALDEQDSDKAYVDYVSIMAGKKVDDPDDCTTEYVLSLRKLMLRDEFLKAPRKRQNEFLDFVEKAVKSLTLRTSLDDMSKQGVVALDPHNPIQPLQPLAPPAPAPQPPIPMGAPQGGFPAPPQAGSPPMPPMPPQQPSILSTLPVPNAVPQPAATLPNQMSASIPQPNSLPPM